MLRLPQRLLTALCYAVWILIVLYPNPALLARSIPRALHPPLDPVAVRAWANELPDEPDQIERRVLEQYVPYSIPWQTYGVPWYFPTTEEVVQRGTGDCQARMLVLASILAAKGIPYELRYSLDHAWVEYPRKEPGTLESRPLAVMVNEGGKMKLRMPHLVQWKETYRIRKELWWDYMPLERKLVLFGGLGMIYLRRWIMTQVRRLSVRG